MLTNIGVNAARVPKGSGMVETESTIAEQEIFERIARDLQARMGVEYERISRTTGVAHDLGMDGDDAVEFLDWYIREFSIEDGALHFSDHFGPEAGFLPFGPFVLIRDLLFPRFRKKPLTVETLISLATKPPKR